MTLYLSRSRKEWKSRKMRLYSSPQAVPCADSEGWLTALMVFHGPVGEME